MGMIVNLPKMGSGIRDVFRGNPISAGSPVGRMAVLRGNISQNSRVVQQAVDSQAARNLSKAGQRNSQVISVKA